jgi:hypothetical protein
VHGVDRRLPHLPARDQRRTKQQLDQLEVERPALLERAQLLEEVELAIQHVGLVRARLHVALKARYQLMLGQQAVDQLSRLHQRVVVPATHELGGHLSLARIARLAHLPAGEDRGADRPQQPERAHGRRDRGHLLRPVGFRRGHLWQLQW